MKLSGNTERKDHRKEFVMEKNKHMECQRKTWWHTETEKELEMKSRRSQTNRCDMKKKTETENQIKRNASLAMISCTV